MPFVVLFFPDSCSQLIDLPGVSPGQHGAQLPSHPTAGNQSSDGALPVFTGRQRQRYLQDEQLLRCYSQAAGTTTGGKHCCSFQVGNVGI